MDECWINIAGLKVRYLESGKGKNRHVLFIHGLGSAADRWMKIPEALSSDFHSIAIDLPGFGESDKPANIDYTIDQFRQFIISFQKKISIHEKKISLIGHSLGGYIASEIAIQNKNQVEQLVLIDSSGMLNQPTPILEEYLNAYLAFGIFIRLMNPSTNCAGILEGSATIFSNAFLTLSFDGFIAALKYSSRIGVG